MPTVTTDLDRCQARLHDGGILWSRTELLRYYNEGYKQLLSRSKAVSRFFIHDVPGRISYSGVWEWEDRHTSKGTYRRFSRLSALDGWAGTFLWEVEQLEGITPTNSSACITQLWERVHSGDIDQHFRFILATSHDQIRRVTHDGKPLAGTSLRELDLSQTKWWREGGDPVYWLSGAGRDGSIEIFEVITTYNQQYELKGFESGMPREPVGESGGRTYGINVAQREYDYAYTTSGDGEALVSDTLRPNLLGVHITQKETLPGDAEGIFLWERQVIDVASSFTDSNPIGTYWWEDQFSIGGIAVNSTRPALGVLRRVTSPDRQYVPQVYDAGQDQVGVGRDFKSSDDSITVLETIIPIRDLGETDTPGLIPQQMRKYLRYYVLHKAFGRSGEGRHPDLAKHYGERFDRGVMFFKRLGELSFRDHMYARASIGPSYASRPPMVRLPPEYPRLD